MRLRVIVPAAIAVAGLAWAVLWAQSMLAQSMLAQSSAPPVTPIDPQAVALFQRLAKHSARLTPLLEQVRVKDWVAKGAPETYVSQLSSAQQQIQGIDGDMAALSQHPERMQESMRALFRIQGFHRSLDSLMGGLRRYQNPALADLIQSVAVEDQEDLGKFQDYVLELANQREQEYQVVDHEAQRCRAVISREPARPKGK